MRRVTNDLSDWYGTHSTECAAENGLDVEMPSATYFGNPLKEAVRSGEVPEARLNDMVCRRLQSQAEMGVSRATGSASDPARGTEKHFSVAQCLCEEGSVLLSDAL